MVFYRKYRPQKIEELDSEELREKLYSVLSGVSSTTDKKGLSYSVPHAFFFTGPKGLGKTSTARIVAKVLNCEGRSKIKDQKSKTEIKNKKSGDDESVGVQIEPCNMCEQCTTITNGTNMDVLEIDAASNRGIDEIRDLREKIRLSPVSANKKVYIIDEVHMLTTEAFNALLKTLEEPPSHAVFILCTTEMQKVPATILSRCFHINFKLATAKELSRSFKRIIKEEKIDIDDDALNYLASLSDGSFRDGVKILEELLISANGKKITKELVEKKYQISNIKFQISNLLKFLEKRDAQSGLKLTGELVEQGVDMKYFVEQIIGELHQMLLVKAGVENNQELRIMLASGRSGNYELGIEDIKKLIELFGKAHGEIKYAVLPQLPLEIAIIEWGMKGDLAGSMSHAANDARQSSSEDSTTKPSSLNERRQQKVANGSEKKSESAFSSFAGEHTSSSKIEDDGSLKLWKEFIEKVKLQNHSVAGVLRGCSLKKFDGKTFIIEAGYKFHKERLEERKINELIVQIAKELIGHEIEVSIVLKEK